MRAGFSARPSGKKYVIVVFTRGVADDVTILPAISKRLLQDF